MDPKRLGGILTGRFWRPVVKELVSHERTRREPGTGSERGDRAPSAVGAAGRGPRNLPGRGGIPLVGAAVAPGGRRDEAQWIPLGLAADFPVGKPTVANFSIKKVDGHLHTTVPRSVWVYRGIGGQVVVYNARCTHLGCLVSLRTASSTFYCPCHGGVFAAEDGRVLDGPPPRPLDRLEYRIDSGQLVVQYQDFRVGIPEKVTL